MLGKRIKLYLTIGLALIINLYFCSALYSDSRQGRGGGQEQGRSGQGNVSAQSRESSPQRSAPPSRQSPPARAEAQAPASRQTAPDRAETQRPAVQSQPSNVRSAEPARQNTPAQTHNVSGNPTVTVRRQQDAPTVTVSPPASQNRNANAASTVVTNKGRENRAANQPQVTVERNNPRQIVKSNPAPAGSVNTNVAKEQPPVKINTERASRIGRNIGDDKNTNVNVGRTNRPADSVALDRNGGRNRNQGDTKVAPKSEMEKIGTVIGKDNPGKGIADNRGGQMVERRVAKDTDNRPGNLERAKDVGGRTLKNERDSRSQIPENSFLRTHNSDSAGKDRAMEQRVPGHREERVFGKNVRETSITRDRNIIDKRVEFRNGQHSRTIEFHDRPYNVRHLDRFEHSYRDYHNNFRTVVTWPGYYFYVGYGCGPSWSFSYVHPYYFHKYLFVSLGGWWPDYGCVRYYWYPYHSYDWYGYYPVPQEVYSGDTSNYYTYNYYGSTDNGSTAAAYTTSAATQPVDETTFADVRARMQQNAERTPDAATQADAYFEEAVKAFEINCFNLAADKFAEAMKLAPDDMILPFAYGQSLVALEKYTEAADVLRTAMVKVTPDKEGVFYPRGLYADEDTLTNQINLLDEKAKLYPYDADLQLILGYQMLGLGELDDAETHLTQANQDIRNAPAANVLLDILAKMKARVLDSNAVQPNLPAVSQPNLK